MKEDSIIARIEKDLIVKRITYLNTLPKDIYSCLKRIEVEAFTIWKLDSVFTGSIMIDSFKACVNSKLTVFQLEEIIKIEGKKYKSFDIFLKKTVKSANKAKLFKSQFNIIKKLSGKIARNKGKV